MQVVRQYREPRPGEVAAFLSRHASWVKAYGDEIRFRPCPVNHCDNAKNPSTDINQKTGLWRCWACGAVGNFYTLTRAFGDPLPESDRYKDDYCQPISKMFTHPFEKQKRRPVSGGHYPELLQYLEKRGITAATADTWRISTKGPKNLRWPIYQWDGTKWVVVNAKMRSIDPDATCRDWFEISGGPTGLLLGNHLFRPEGPNRIIITEGQWDAMTLTELGFENVMSLPNGAESINVGSMLRYIPDHFEIWLSFDMDDAGQRGIEKFFAQYGPEKVARLKLPYKDLNEWYCANPFISQRDVEATLVGLTNLSAVYSPSKKKYLDLSLNADDDNSPTLIATSPWDRLNEIIGGGFFGGQTTGLLAPSGRGKTSLCNQLAIWGAQNGVDVGLISLEGTRDELKRKLKDCIRATCDQGQIERIGSHLHVSKLEGGKVTWQECIAEFGRMITEGCRFLIFDNPDHICRDDNHAKIECYREVVAQAQAFGTHTIVVWQPNKVDRIAVVNSGNQKGYSQNLQDADLYLNLNRINGATALEVEKNRINGKEGIVWLSYDPASRSFSAAKPLAIASKIIPISAMM